MHYFCVTIIVVICMKNTKDNKKENTLKKIDKITKIFTIVVCVLLGSIFLAACAYMVKMINEEQSGTVSNTNVPQNLSLVNM